MGDETAIKESVRKHKKPQSRVSFVDGIAVYISLISFVRVLVKVDTLVVKVVYPVRKALLF